MENKTVNAGKESEDLQKQGWIVSEMKTVEGTKVHVLYMPNSEPEKPKKVKEVKDEK